MNALEISHEIKIQLSTAYGSRFRGLVLYGSEARNEALPDSDIDLLCLLEGPVGSTEIIRINDVTYDLRLDSDRQFHVVPADILDYEAAEFGFIKEIRREGVLL